MERYKGTLFVLGAPRTCFLFQSFWTKTAIQMQNAQLIISKCQHSLYSLIIYFLFNKCLDCHLCTRTHAKHRNYREETGMWPALGEYTL